MLGSRPAPLPLPGGYTSPASGGGGAQGCVGGVSSSRDLLGAGTEEQGLSASQPGAGGAQARPGGGPGFQPCLHLLLTLLPGALCWLFLGLVISEVGIMISRIASHDRQSCPLKSMPWGGRAGVCLKGPPLLRQLPPCPSQVVEDLFRVVVAGVVCRLGQPVSGSDSGGIGDFCLGHSTGLSNLLTGLRLLVGSPGMRMGESRLVQVALTSGSALAGLSAAPLAAGGSWHALTFDPWVFIVRPPG